MKFDGEEKKRKKNGKSGSSILYFLWNSLLCKAQTEKAASGWHYDLSFDHSVTHEKKQNTHKQGFKQIIISVAAGQGKHLTSEDESNHKSQCNSPVSASVENQYI